MSLLIINVYLFIDAYGPWERSRKITVQIQNVVKVVTTPGATVGDTYFFENSCP